MQGEALVEAVSGAVGSILALLATFPLKTIYTLQALSADAKGTGAAPVLSVLDIIAKYRLQGLYAGIGPSVFESGLSSAVYYYLYSRLRELAVQAKSGNAGAVSASADSKPAGASTKNQSIGIVASLLVAAVAGIGNQLVTMPAAVVITRMQAQQKRKVESAGSAASTSVMSIIQEIWSENGLPGFWAGLLPALILVVNPAIQYMLYEQMLRVLRMWKSVRQQRQQEEEQRHQRHGQASSSCAKVDTSASPAPKPSQDPVGRLSAGEIFLASALAKIGATVATYPMIVVKSRMQAASKSSPHNQGTLAVISRTLQDEGVGGFFKGLKAKILQTALNAALMLMLKEQCYDFTKAAAANSAFTSARLPGAKAALLKAA